MINEEQNLFRKIIEPKTNFTSYLIQLVCKTGSSNIKGLKQTFLLIHFLQSQPIIFPFSVINLVNNMWAESRD